MKNRQTNLARMVIGIIIMAFLMTLIFYSINRFKRGSQDTASSSRAFLPAVEEGRDVAVKMTHKDQPVVMTLSTYQIEKINQLLSQSAFKPMDMEKYRTEEIERHAMLLEFSTDHKALGTLSGTKEATYLLLPQKSEKNRFSAYVISDPTVFEAVRAILMQR